MKKVMTDQDWEREDGRMSETSAWLTKIDEEKDGLSEEGGRLGLMSNLKHQMTICHKRF